MRGRFREVVFGKEKALNKPEITARPLNRSLRGLNYTGDPCSILDEAKACNTL